MNAANTHFTLYILANVFSLSDARTVIQASLQSISISNRSFHAPFLFIDFVWCVLGICLSSMASSLNLSRFPKNSHIIFLQHSPIMLMRFEERLHQYKISLID